MSQRSDWGNVASYPHVKRLSYVEMASEANQKDEF